MNAIIVDDERLAREELKNLLASHRELTVIGEAPNARDASVMIDELKPDLVFLDIQMPGKTGFEMLEDISHLPEIIFVTAHDEHAIRAFEVNALDYLLKPVNPDRLHEALKKATSRRNGQAKETKFPKEKLTDQDQVFVKDGEKCWFVNLAEIRLFESEGNYVRVFFGNNRPLILRSLNSLDERLDPSSFFRASRKHIINLKWIEKIENWFSGGLLVSLKGGEKVEISRRQAAKFRDTMTL